MRILFVFIALVSGLLVGCDSNSTNAPTADAIKSADVNRAAAIDADKTMTPEGKAKMKEMLGLTAKPKSEKR